MPVDKTRFTARQSSPSSRLSLPLAAARAPRRMRILRVVPVVFTQRHIPNVNPRPRASSSSPIASHRIASHRRARTNIRRRVHRPARGFTTAKVKKRPRRRRRPASRSSSTARRHRRSRRHSRARRERRRRHRHRCHHHHRHRRRPCSSLSPPGPPSPVSRLPSSSSSFPKGCSIHHPTRGLGPSSRRPTDRPFDRPTVRPTDRSPDRPKKRVSKKVSKKRRKKPSASCSFVRRVLSSVVYLVGDFMVFV